jgi:hypothetical protein
VACVPACLTEPVSLCLLTHAMQPVLIVLLHCRGSDGKSLEPEVYPRPNGTTYICGVADEDAPVPPTAADVLPRPAAIAALQGVAASVSQELGAAELLQEQACYLPTTEDGLPLIGRVPGLENAYVATGKRSQPGGVQSKQHDAACHFTTALQEDLNAVEMLTCPPAPQCRSQLLGHPDCSGHRGGSGRADRGWQGK